ncbi:hypothetical protein [Ruminococcus flavefaciens]|uniref:hypothetical protein n=1 Tax=Ruminococcus flavefaciens TaxID=1265 RepID=UPI00048ABAA4|nr:hypothetical protein [Ruminococcus flavefaciens]
MKVFLFLTGCMIAIQLTSLLKLIFFIIFAPFAGMTVSRVSFLAFSLSKQDGRWGFTSTEFTPIIQSLVTYRRDLPAEKCSEKKSNIMTMAVHITVLVISAAAAVLIMLKFHSYDGPLKWLMYGIGFGMVFMSLQSIVIFIYTMMSIMNRLGGYMSANMKRIRNGESLGSLDLRPVEQLGFKKVTDAERIFYYGLYSEYLTFIGDYDGLRAPSHEIMNLIIGRQFISQETLTYYCLLFFFSEIEPNRQFADMLFNRIKGTIINDTDPNGKRVMAYYAFNIYNDIAGAERFLSEAYAALGKWTGILASEAELEKKLLDILSDRIAQAKAAPQPQPAMNYDNRIM